MRQNTVTLSCPMWKKMTVASNFLKTAGGAEAERRGGQGETAPGFCCQGPLLGATSPSVDLSNDTPTTAKLSIAAVPLTQSFENNPAWRKGCQLKCLQGPGSTQAQGQRDLPWDHNQLQSTDSSIPRSPGRGPANPCERGLPRCSSHFF